MTKTKLSRFGDPKNDADWRLFLKSKNKLRENNARETIFPTLARMRRRQFVSEQESRRAEHRRNCCSGDASDC